MTTLRLACSVRSGVRRSSGVIITPAWSNNRSIDKAEHRVRPGVGDSYNPLTWCVTSPHGNETPLTYIGAM